MAREWPALFFSYRFEHQTTDTSIWNKIHQRKFRVRIKTYKQQLLKTIYLYFFATTRIHLTIA